MNSIKNMKMKIINSTNLIKIIKKRKKCYYMNMLINIIHTCVGSILCTYVNSLYVINLIFFHCFIKICRAYYKTCTSAYNV